MHGAVAFLYSRFGLFLKFEGHVGNLGKLKVDGFFLRLFLKFAIVLEITFL